MESFCGLQSCFVFSNVNWVSTIQIEVGSTNIIQREDTVDKGKELKKSCTKWSDSSLFFPIQKPSVWFGNLNNHFLFRSLFDLNRDWPMMMRCRCSSVWRRLDARWKGLFTYFRKFYQLPTSSQRASWVVSVIQKKSIGNCLKWEERDHLRMVTYLVWLFKYA